MNWTDGITLLCVSFLSCWATSWVLRWREERRRMKQPLYRIRKLLRGSRIIEVDPVDGVTETVMPRKPVPVEFGDPGYVHGGDS